MKNFLNKFFVMLSVGMLIPAMLTGCGRSFDSAGYVTAMMDALYKGDYAAYADFTGITTSEVSLYRDSWLENTTDNFMTLVGSGTPSDETRERAMDLFKKIYANAKYEVTVNPDDGSIVMTISPIDLIAQNNEAIMNYVNDFNAKNDAFAFASLTEPEFYDTYLDGILTILESNLAQLSWLEPMQMTITISQDEEGLYTITSDTLAEIQNTILKWPE